MNSGGYTYVRLTRDDCDVWVAAQEFTVRVGESLTVAVDMTMRDFHSPNLNRTFPSVHFASQVAREGQTLAGPSGRGPVASLPSLMSSHGPGAAVSPGKPVTVPKVLPPAGGLAIADVFAKRQALSGRRVVVRGTVVKVNRGILDRDWLHIQDGSGTIASRDHDLTVTVESGAPVPALGELVTASGVLGTEQDLGAGYTYDAILENAAISR